jgi:hypothetical protein
MFSMLNTCHETSECSMFTMLNTCHETSECSMFSTLNTCHETSESSKFSTRSTCHENSECSMFSTLKIITKPPKLRVVRSASSTLVTKLHKVMTKCAIILDYREVARIMTLRSTAFILQRCIDYYSYDRGKLQKL